MKVLFLSNPNSVHTKRWVKSLSECGIKIHIHSFVPCIDNLYYEELKNVTLSCFADIKYKNSNTLIRLFRFYIPLIKSIKKIYCGFNPDLVHAHYASNNGLFAALSKVRPFLLTVWGSDIYKYPQRGKLRKYITKYVLAQADVITSSSKVMAEEAKKYSDKQIKIIPFGVDTDLFSPSDVHRPDENFFTVGCVKSLKKIYCIDVLIKAFKLVKDNYKGNLNLRLVILGDGEEKETLKQLIAELQLEENVSLKGHVDNEMLTQFYNSFNVFCVLSESESFGVSTVEAMACGVPVITSDAPGFTEVVENGISGYIVERNSAEKTAEKIELFLNNPELAKNIGKNGRERVLSKFDWNDNVNTMVSTYESMI